MWDSEALPAVAPELPPGLRDAAGGMLEVLETMFFELPIAPLREDSPPADVPGAAVEFTGTRRGRLDVRLDAAAARRLAASFLGREDERTVTGPEIELVTLELANMLCGAALSRIEPQGRFRIEAPRLESSMPEGAGPWLVAPLESGRVAVRLECEEAA